jgi:uncharacterized protein (TIRG00374 family)
MKKNMTISFIGGVLLSTGALYFAFKNVPLAELFKYLASINYFWVLPAILVTVLSFILRAVRWQIILESTCRISIWRAFHPLMIGFMINCVLPGRLGELARPVILQKEEKVPFATGLATVVTERVFDIFLLILLFMLTAGALRISSDQTVAFGTYQLNQETLQTIFDTMLKLGAVLIAGIAIFSIGKARNLIYSAILLTPTLFFFAGKRFKATVRKKICEPVINILNNIAQGFALIRYPKKIFLCVGFSALIWGLQAFSYYLFSLGSPGINLTFLEITTVMVIICFFISLPSVPGFWGLWEAGGVFALSLFGISAKDAAGFTLANHAIQVIPVILVGIVSAMILSVNIRRLSFEGKEFKDAGI